MTAEVLFDYFRPGSAVNGKGRIIGPGPHYDGNSFDIGGGDNLKKIGERIEFCKTKPETWIHSYLVEEVNNCVHCDVTPI